MTLNSGMGCLNGKNSYNNVKEYKRRFVSNLIVNKI